MWEQGSLDFPLLGFRGTYLSVTCRGGPRLLSCAQGPGLWGTEYPRWALRRTWAPWPQVLLVEPSLSSSLTHPAMVGGCINNVGLIT